MKKSFSHLIWLGAGQAKEPSSLINQAKQVTLVDARESACEYLNQQFTSDHVQVISQLLTLSGEQQIFTEYNLPEYSALQTATGLQKLFPGLKITRQETITSVSLEQFFKGIRLTDEKNVLVVDLPDINLPFLEALHKTSEIYNFNKIYIFANHEPLYLDAVSASGITNFFHSIGYLLQETVSTDPDFPCLVFGLNPLWLEFQQAKNLNIKLTSDTKELQSQQAVLKQQLTTQQQQKETNDKEHERLKQELVELKKQFDLAKKENESLKQEIITQQQQKERQDKEQEKLKQQLADQQKKLTEANGLFDQATKQSASRKDTVGKLEKEKRELEELNKNLELKQNLLEKELIKAESQIELIKILLVKA